jgi:hypothetical protein
MSMALPDRFEQVGILIGSMFLVGLPVSALVSVVSGFGIRPWAAAVIWFLPGLVVGIPLTKGSLPVTYHQVWVMTVSSWVLAFASWAALGLSLPASDTTLAVAVWLLAVLIGGLIAWTRPLSFVRRHFQHA